MLKVAHLAGGCFWGVEELFRNLNGVKETRVGYMGGNEQFAFPAYRDITTGRTGHAEAIEVTYDAEILSYKDLLRFFFKIHDPTTKNRQGNDVGTQYRSAIFFQNDDEKKTAEDLIQDIDSKKVFPGNITTTLEVFKEFYLAEEYHQAYLQKNPGGYSCHFVRGIDI